MSERVILQWNLPNWITVVLMVTIGVTIVNIALALIRGRIDSSAE